MSTHHCLIGEGHDDTRPDIPNKAAEGVSYYTPAQEPPAGTAVDPQPSGTPIPKLFTPITLRGLTLQNRILLSPLCQYSAQDGHHTAWHHTHLGGIIQRGPGLTMVEATAVQANGRISPEDSGLWQDSQIALLRTTVEFAHSQGQKIGIQLGHAGRKASTIAPWLSGGSTATAAVGGWPRDVWAPSAIPYKGGEYPCPQAMSLRQIADFKSAFLDAVRRAIEAGFDLVQIHAAHGYLLHEFLSPASNARTDEYGGSFENRARLVLEVVRLVRAAIPEAMPLGLRISATDWLDVGDYEGESWRLEDTVRLAPLLAEAGVDWLDVSTGGNHPAQKIAAGPGYQAPFAKAVKRAVGDAMAVSTVGMIESATLAQELLEGRGPGEEEYGRVALDMVVVGRGFQKNPGLVWAWADELGVEIHLANQIAWGFRGRRGRKK